MADGLKEVGVALVAKNETGFVQSLNRANQSVTSFGMGAKEAMVSVAGGATSAIPGINQLAKAVAVGNIYFTAAQIAMKAVVGTITGLTQAVTQTTSAMFNKAVQIQQVELGLQSLAAREQMAAGKAKDMNEALEQSIPITDELMKKIRALDEVSPFSYEDVLSAFRTNMAFGQTMETSIGLTKAILDVAAASGQGSYVIQRLAYNFSQMTLTGQITMRDFRDLSMAGFDLARMLREELGMSIQEVNTALKAGEITMQQVSQAFMDYAEKNFGGAAQRMAETIPGVMSSFQGLFAVISDEVFGESAANLGKALKDIYDFVSQIVNSGIFQVFGAVLDVLTGKIAEITGEIPDLNDSMLEDIADSMMSFIEAMFDFGLGMMEAFAEGVIAGGSVVIDAVLAITQMIGNLLMPGSPPKALPNIDKWGAGAMLEYLRGFTQADFGVLDTIQNKIKSALSILDIDKTGEIYKSLSVQLSKALATGNLDTGFLNTLAKQLGPYGGEVAKLVKLEFELATAMEAVDKARKAESAAMTKLQRMVYEYNKAVKEGADPATLAEKKKLIDAQSDETQAAIEARMEAEKGIENIALLEEQVKLQRELVDAILDMGRAMKQAKAMSGAGGGGGGDGLGIGAGGGVDVSSAISAWEAKIEEFKTRLSAKIDETFKSLKTTWDSSALGQFVNKISEVFSPENTQEERIQAFFDIIFGKTIDTSTAEKITKFIDDLSGGIGKLVSPVQLEGIAQFSVKAWTAGKVIDMVFGPAAPIVKAITNIWNLLAALVALSKWSATGFDPSKAPTIKLPVLGEIDFSVDQNKAKTEIQSVIDTLPEPDWSMYAIAPPEESLASVMGFFDTAKATADSAMNGEGGMVPVTNAATETILAAMNTTYQTVVDEVTTKTTEAATVNKTNMEGIQKDTEENLTKVETKAKSATSAIKTGFDDTVKSVDALTKALQSWAKEVLSGNTSLALAKLMEILGHQSLPPVAVGANDIKDAIEDLASSALPKLSKSVDGLTSPPAYAYAGASNTTYNVSIPVTAQVGGNADIHQLAYVIAREFNQRINR